jgi:hypothetical protein
MALKKQLKDFLANGDFEQCFTVMGSLLPVDTESYDTFVLLQGRYRKNKRREQEGTASRADMNLEDNQIRKGLLTLIGELPDHPYGARGLPPIHEHHKFTCNREDQYEGFQELRKQQEKIHYYYIYGLENHSHRGLFRRFAYDLEGKLDDYLNPNIETCKVFRAEIPCPYKKGEELYKREMIRKLFVKFCNSVNDQEPLLDKTLLDLLNSSPHLRNYQSGDHVCIFFSIHELDWHDKLTPGLVLWFIENFCAVELPPDSPQFFFFFGVLYEDEGSEVREQVQEVLKTAKYLSELPELDMVSHKDIRRWFLMYQLYDTSTERKQKISELFGDRREFYMETVEQRLGRLIEEYNSKR